MVCFFFIPNKINLNLPAPICPRLVQSVLGTTQTTHHPHASSSTEKEDMARSAGIHTPGVSARHSHRDVPRAAAARSRAPAEHRVCALRDLAPQPRARVWSRENRARVCARAVCVRYCADALQPRRLDPRHEPDVRVRDVGFVRGDERAQRALGNVAPDWAPCDSGGLVGCHCLVSPEPLVTNVVWTLKIKKHKSIYEQELQVSLACKQSTNTPLTMYQSKCHLNRKLFS